VPPEVAVVIPTYNEAQNLELIVKAVRGHGYGVVVVDDNSPDGTGDIANGLAEADTGVIVVHRPRKEGLGPAYAEGFAKAHVDGAAIICEMDADFSHDPDTLPDLIEAVNAGAGLAIGSRYVPGGSVPGWALSRRLISRAGNWYARFMLGTPIKDMTSGFRAYQSQALQTLEPATCEASGYVFQVEMARRAHESGTTVVEIPITFRDRLRGDSKMSWRIALEAMRLVTLWGVKKRLGR
jgi:dolichol-phosphate mannosyltransferase